VIILARHGRTVFNETGRYQGACDSPLTPLGFEQARKVGALVRALVQGDVTLWSSPLGRAVATAEIIKDVARLRCDLTLDDRLREVSLGRWDGLTDEEIEDLDPGACDGASRFDWFFRAPDGETFDHAEARLRDWLGEVDAQPGSHVVVSHGLSGRILRGAYAGLPKSETIKLDVPQDMVFTLAYGRCELFGSPCAASHPLADAKPGRRLSAT
jgi:probable phosphoglycerate mutase